MTNAGRAVASGTALFAYGVAVGGSCAALVPALALGLGALALALLDAAGRSAWIGAGGVVLAVLHARLLPPDAPASQLGLAAFALTTAASTLVTPRARPRLWVVLAVGGALGLALTWPAGAPLAGLVGGGLAVARPFTVLALAAGRRPDDPWLAWSPLAAGGAR